MVQDFNEYINALNRYARESGVRTSMPQNSYARLQSNPVSMFYPNQLTQQDAMKQIQEAVGDTSKSVAKAGAKNSLVKTALKYAPITGDIYDIGRGLYQATHGHPYVGLGQAGLGAFGIATLGAGSIAKSGGKALAKKALQSGMPKTAIRNIQKLAKGEKLTRSAKYQAGSAILPELLYNTNREAIDNVEPVATSQDNNINNLPPVPTETIPDGYYVSYDDILSSGGKGQIPTTLPMQQPDYEIIGDIATSGNGNINTIDLLNKYQQQLLEANRPYIEGLEAYYNNYDKNLRDARNWDRYFTGLAGFSGNSKWADLSGRYDPLAIEANKLNILKQLQDAKYGNVNEINKLQGNMALAQTLGLPEEAALANKDLLNAYVNQQKAQLGYNAKVYDTNIDNATRVAIKKGDWDTAFKLQSMKNEGNLRNAFASSAPFYMDTNRMVEVMKMLGENPSYVPAARGLNEQGLPNVQPAINYFANQER